MKKKCKTTWKKMIHQLSFFSSLQLRAHNYVYMTQCGYAAPAAISLDRHAAAAAAAANNERRRIKKERERERRRND